MRWRLARLVYRPVLLAAVLLALAAQSRPVAQTQEPRFRGGANLVRLDVYASKDGVAVTDLTAADFEVLEDNTPQTVTSFELVKARGVVPEAARVEPNTVAESRARVSQPDARVFVLFLDTPHVQVEGSYHAQNPVAALLDRVVGEDDLVGVMTPEMSARNVTFSPRTAPIGDMLRSNWAWGERGRVSFSDPRDEHLRTCYPDAGETAGIAMALIERRQETRTLEALEDLLNELEAQRDERSFVLLLTEGWTLPSPDERLARALSTGVPGPAPLGTTPDGRLGVGSTQNARDLQSCERERSLLALADLASTFRLLTQRANRANVSFYPVDPRGLVVFDSPMTSSRPVGLVADARRLASRQNGLRTLAEATDGTVILNANIDRALPRLLTDIGSYYLLGYTSTNQKLDGRYRRLSVRVTRPGVEVRARPGYLAPSAAEFGAAQAPAQPRPSSGVERALSSLPSTRRVPPIYLHAVGGAGQVRLTLELDRATAALPEWGSGATIAVEFDAADGRGGAARRTETATLAAGVRTLSLRQPLDGVLPPGTYQIRVQASAASGVRGAPVTVSTTVTVPQAAALLGSGALASRRGPGTGRLFQPTADPRFRRTERIIFETPLMSSAAAVSARLLNRAGQVMALPLALSTRGEEGLTWSVAELALAPLAPGEYVAEVAATLGDKTDTVSYGFRIVP